MLYPSMDLKGKQLTVCTCTMICVLVPTRQQARLSKSLLSIDLEDEKEMRAA